MGTGGLVAKAKAQPSFSNIPNETLAQILHFCGYTTIINFSSTCKRYFELVSNSAGLQLHIELEANGLEVAKGSNKSNVDYPRILNELKNYRDAWLDFNTGSPIYHPVSPEDNMELCEIDKDSFIGAYHYPSNQGRTYPNALQVHPLGSAPLPLVHFPLAFHGFASDLAHDLFVLIAVNSLSPTRAEIHFKSSTTGQNHPLAVYPTLTVEAPFSISYALASQLFVKVMENVLLVKLDNALLQSYEVLLWDWQSGVFLCRVSSQGGICDASFLDRAHFILYSASRGKVEASARWSVSLLVYDIPTTPRSTPDSPPDTHLRARLYPNARPTLKLEFPKMTESMSVLPSGFMLKSDPLPGRTVYESSVTFSSSHAMALKLGLSLCDSHGKSRIHFSIYVDAARIRSGLDSYQWGGTSTTVPWNEWGPRTTRWFNEVFEADGAYWPSISCGSRHVYENIAETGPLSSRWSVSILDFQPPKVARRSSPLSLDPSDLPLPDEFESFPGPLPCIKSSEITLVDGWLDDLLPALKGPIQGPYASSRNPANAPLGDDMFAATIGSGIKTIIPQGFEEPVETQLPFRAVTKARPCPSFETWMMSSNYVIGFDLDDEVALYAYPLQTSLLK